VIPYSRNPIRSGPFEIQRTGDAMVFRANDLQVPDPEDRRVDKTVTIEIPIHYSTMSYFNEVMLEYAKQVMPRGMKFRVWLSGRLSMWSQALIRGEKR